MSSIPVDLVDGVVSRLNAATFTQSFVPEKVLAAQFINKDIDALKVFVYTDSIEWVKQTRTGVYTRDYTIVVAVVGLCGITNSEIEPFIELCEEIKDDLATQRITNLNCVEISQEVPYNSDFLVDQGMFLAKIDLTYRRVA